MNAEEKARILKEVKYLMQEYNVRNKTGIHGGPSLIGWVEPDVTEDGLVCFRHRCGSEPEGEFTMRPDQALGALKQLRSSGNLTPRELVSKLKRHDKQAG